MVCDPELISVADSAARDAVILLQRYFEHDGGTEFLPSLSAMHSYYGILGLAIFPTAGRLRISKLCISYADQRMPMRHRMEPLSLNDTASPTAQFTAHSTGGRL
ncbi:uncharacterized protein LOC142776119 [Rhipicephalus microplus]|uniref:uncharacterized protein LOC142776119 n=1 Tax=Rhipicephalus microplus TaxID=6941 RepID=UPI003F6C0B18